MATTLVTGGSGLIGARVARELVLRGDRVRVTRRRGSDTAALAGVEHEEVVADVLDRRALRRALRGVERVFHTAGATSLRADPQLLFEVNVRGTRTVLEECLRAGVQRVVLTSSVAAIGPADRGAAADETHLFPAEARDIPYVNAMHEAELEALRVAAAGLEVVVVCPAHVLGHGEAPGAAGDIVRQFMLRRIPAYLDGGINVVDAHDVARGHLLADERGQAGERYILGARNYSWERLYADLGRVSGIEPPALKLSFPVAMAMARAAESLPGRPPLTVTEVRVGARWWTYRSTKARRELGWSTTPHEDTIESAVAWYREREGPMLARSGTRQPASLRLAGFAGRQLAELAARAGL